MPGGQNGVAGVAGLAGPLRADSPPGLPRLPWSMHGIPFSYSPGPEDISVFLLPNLCCASKICSWVASRAEKASPRSAEKEGGGAGQGSDQTAKGVQLEGLGGRQGLPNSRMACWRGPRLLLSPCCGFSEPLASHPGTPGAGPLQSSPPAGRAPTSFWPSLSQEQQATAFGSRL